MAATIATIPSFGKIAILTTLNMYVFAIRVAIRRTSRASWGLLFAVASCAGDSANAAPESSVDFNRDVRPILSDACFHCHGPDPSHRQALLRLDNWSGDDEAMGAEQVIAAGEPSDSALIDRIATLDPELRMPPPDSGKALTTEQIEVLRRWVAEGAEYQPHWALVQPHRSQVPSIANAEWARNPIDQFVFARLESEGLSPSPAADHGVLLRRLYLDILGLPPALDQQAEADDLPSDERYAQLVDQLLASPHFGERWGRLWLDAASYADSNGFEKDRPRDVWMYRDWVVQALNNDMPYDQFVVEQVAGDLLSNAEQSQLIATGFLRNTMLNEEGGIDPEQFRMEALFARMDILGKSVLGLTVQCAQCHTHKYDPISHRDYYRLLAFLNNDHEAHATVYPREAEKQRRELLAGIARIEQELRDTNLDWRDRMVAWAESQAREMNDWQIARPELDGSGGQKHRLLEDGSVLAEGYSPSQVTTQFTVRTNLEQVTAVRLELLPHPTLPHNGPGRSTEGLCALTEMKVTVHHGSESGGTSNVPISRVSADVNPNRGPLAERFDDRSGQERFTGPASMAIDDDRTTAWSIDRGPGRSNVAHSAVFVFDKPLPIAGDSRLTFHLVQQHGESYHEDIYTNNLGRFRFALTDVEPSAGDALPTNIRQIVQRSADSWSAAEEATLFSHWRTTIQDWEVANQQIESLWQQHPDGISQLVLKRRDRPRRTHVLARGDFLKPAEPVTAGVPGFLHPLGAAEPDRLDFACWLVDNRSPTAARVIVNRIWQAYFGTGLVETAEDFGVQGTPPSHPELLDWLAVELMDNAWSLKHIHRLIVTSATYRQSSRVTPELLQRDPQNRLLARGARFRIDAETIRDVNLAASGLLNRELGGPSVYPPAPEYLFVPPASYSVKPWPFDTGAAKYRRGLYTFRYRSLLYPVYQTFDAPTGEASCARRIRSNTPTQALVSLNEAIFVECARALATATVKSAVTEPRDRVDYMFRRCLGRPADDLEAEVILSFVNTQRSRLEQGDLDAQQLLGEGEDADVEEIAAWTTAARVILNLDEVITRQ